MGPDENPIEALIVLFTLPPLTHHCVQIIRFPSPTAGSALWNPLSSKP